MSRAGGATLAQLVSLFNSLSPGFMSAALEALRAVLDAAAAPGVLDDAPQQQAAEEELDDPSAPGEPAIPPAGPAHNTRHNAAGGQPVSYPVERRARSGRPRKPHGGSNRGAAGAAAAAAAAAGGGDGQVESPSGDDGAEEEICEDLPDLLPPHEEADFPAPVPLDDGEALTTPVSDLAAGDAATAHQRHPSSGRITVPNHASVAPGTGGTMSAAVTAHPRCIDFSEHPLNGLANGAPAQPGWLFSLVRRNSDMLSLQACM
jgi:hypothetical protein